ncbi:MAG: Lrp/AsnC family transcriptional regulator [Alicyclobacillus sp.]|nr:Lrp/AsnC family transcriptional regulator [Alicyclobacillus sp.]
MAIIDCVAQNGRIPFVEIASLVNVSEATVRNRVQRLTTSGILTFVGVVDPFRTGLYSVALIAIQVEETMLHEACQKLSQLKQTRFVVACAGLYNVMVEVLAYTTEELMHFVADALPSIPGIRQFTVSQELKLYKNAFNYVRGAES